MAEQIFKSPGFFEREVEIIARPNPANRVTPVAIVGTAEKGPAFVPRYISSTQELEETFGRSEKKRPGLQAAYEFFQNDGRSIEYCRVLGSGLKDELGAGFSIEPVEIGSASTLGGNFDIITATITAATASVGTAVTDIFDSPMDVAVGAIVAGTDYTTLFGASVDTTTNQITQGSLTSSDTQSVSITNNSFAIKFVNNTDAAQTKGPFNVSLDRNSSLFIEKVLNTDPTKLSEEGYVLYKSWPIDSTLVTASTVTIVNAADVDKIKDLGDYSNRFSSPSTPKLISQPFGSKEYDLFSVEFLDHGEYASRKYKISITDLIASTDPNDKFGSFSVVVRDLEDTDDSKVIYETFTNCSLNPDADNFIARVIGDKKEYFHFDAASEDERRVIVEGLYENRSSIIRVNVSDDVLNKEIPAESLPFGFRGIDSLHFSNTDTTHDVDVNTVPLPMRSKVTKGDRENAAFNSVSDRETVDANLYWGIQTSLVDVITQPNNSSNFNTLLYDILSYTGKGTVFNLQTPSSKDSNNHNKFSLSRVRFGNENSLVALSDILSVEGKKLYYDRKNSNTTIKSLADLLVEDPVKFNRMSIFAKFTVPVQGGWSGLNPFDKDMHNMTDRSASNEIGGKALAFSSQLLTTTITSSGLPMHGVENLSNNVVSYKNAIRAMTDVMSTNNNVLVVPGIRSPLVTDFAARRVSEYGKSIYLMDIPSHDKLGTRLFVDAEGRQDGKTDVLSTADAFNSRNMDNSYVAAYFPDVMILDAGDDDEGRLINQRVVRAPASVAALSAIATTDEVSSPWFAPAGFGRGGLTRVKGLDVRLNTKNRDDLYESRINPIANFPNNQFVIFGQKTTQVARTALDRVNVRRLVLEVKRRIELIAQGLLFAQNNQATKDRFISSASSELAEIQLGSGIEGYRVIMDSTNNTDADVDNNRLNGKIIIVPTRAVEFIQIDFVITNSGVSYP